MQRIILTEFNPTKGHANLFANTFKLLSRDFEVLAVTTSDNDKISDDRCIKIPVAYYKKKQNYLYDLVSFFIYSIQVLRRIKSIIKETQINNVICLTYDEVSLFLLTPFLPSYLSIYLMSHANIDNYANSRIKKWMFKRIKDRYFHIVQCGFLAEHLEKNYQLKDVLVWPHPLNRIEEKKIVRDIDCAGLSFSNDEKVLSHLLEMEESTQIFKKNNLRVVLKSQQISFDDGNLTIIKGSLSSPDYDDIINRSKSILMPFPSSFKMRMSGTLIDSLTNRKAVFATPISVIQESHKQYPYVIKEFSEDTFVKELMNYSLDDNCTKDFDRFLLFHEDTNLSNIMYSNLSASLEGKSFSNQFDF